MDSLPRWLGWLPESLRVRITNRPNLQRIIASTGWLFIDKVCRLGVGLLVGVWVARYLGPEQFGAFNYAIAIVGIFTAVGTLGLNGIVVRDLVRNPSSADVTLGTAFYLQILGGFCALLLALSLVAYTKPEDSLASLMVAVFGSVMVLKATDVVKYWFESKVHSKSIVIVENGAFLFFSMVRVVLVLTKAPLMAFVWITLAEGVLVAAGLMAIYSFHGYKIRNWEWQLKRAKALVSDSWPLVLSGLAVMVYMRIDQVMLGQMLGDKEVGVFSAAVRISEAFYFVPMMIVTSVFPAIIDAKERSDQLYKKRLKNLFELMIVLALGFALPISLMSEWIVSILYGAAFSDAAQVLAVQVWAGVFVFSGVASSRWFLIEGLQKYSFYRTLAGAIINVVLNFIFIPKFGVSGAAWATLGSQAVASVLFNLSNSKTRPIFYMQIKAIFGISFFQK